jgi:hypothetical protein
MPAQIIRINLNIQIRIGMGYHSQSPHFIHTPLSFFKFGTSVLFSTYFIKPTASIPPAI